MERQFFLQRNEKFSGKIGLKELDIHSVPDVRTSLWRSSPFAILARASGGRRQGGGKMKRHRGKANKKQKHKKVKQENVVQRGSSNTSKSSQKARVAKAQTE